MKKITKVICIISLAIVLLLGWFVYQNWNTIDAIVHSFGTTAEDTLKELEQTKKELQAFLESEENIVVRDLTEEESKALNEGELTEQDVIEIITGQSSEEEHSINPQQSGDSAGMQNTTEEGNPTGIQKPTGVQEPVQTKKPVETLKPTPTQKPVSDSERKISELVAKLYVQKSIYLGKLDGIESKVRAEYLANPKKWGSKKNAKNALLNKYMPEVASWEKQCDSTVNGILNEIRTELKKQGKDESIVDTMKKSYLEEKKLKKTYFINRYMD